MTTNALTHNTTATQNRILQNQPPVPVKEEVVKAQDPQRINKTPGAVVDVMSAHPELFKAEASYHPSFIACHNEAPSLKPPDGDMLATEPETLTSQATQTRLIATLALLSRKVTETEELQQINLMRLRQQKAAEKYDEIAQALDKALSNFGELLDKLKDIQTELKNLAAEAALLQTAIAEHEKELAALTPDMPRYDIVLKLLAEKQVEMSACLARQARAEADYKRAVETAAGLSENIDSLRNQANKAVQNLPLEMTMMARETNINRSGLFIQYITVFLSLINEANIKDIEHQAEVYKVTNELRIKDLTEQSEEIARKNKNSKILSKVLSGLGVLLGILLAVTAVFTGGSALALGVAIVGCVISLADTITLLVADFSFMGKAMSWIQEKLAWVFEHTVGIVLEDITLACGADESTAEDIKDYTSQILGTIYTVILFMLPMLALAKNPGAALRPITEGAKGIMNMVRVGAIGIKGGVETSVKVSADVLNFQATQEIAENEITNEEIDELNRVREKMAEILASVQEVIREQTTTMMRAFETNTETANKILYNTGRTGAV